VIVKKIHPFCVPHYNLIGFSVRAVREPPQRIYGTLILLAAITTQLTNMHQSKWITGLMILSSFVSVISSAKQRTKPFLFNL